MNKFIACLALLASMAAACSSADTTTAVPATSTAVQTEGEEPPDPDDATASAPESQDADDTDPAAATTTTLARVESADSDTEADEATTTTTPATEAADSETEPGDTPTTTRPASDQAETATTTTQSEPGSQPEAEPGTGSDPVTGDNGADTGGSDADAAAIPTTTIPQQAEDSTPAAADAPADAWVAGINAAGWNFHRQLRGNAVSSPISIGTAFSLSRAGASPESAEALDRIFGFPTTGAHAAANAVNLALAEASVDPTTLEVANRLFSDDNFTMRAEFVEAAATNYGAAVETVDTADAGPAAAAINDWVSQQTRGLIPAIVDPGGVQGQQLLLVNTVYLKADWQQPFDPGLTIDRPFYLGDGGSVTVPFMGDYKAAQRRYARLAGADAVELPYQGGELAMWLIVPHHHSGLAAIEESLSAAAITAMSRSAQRGSVMMMMPKWEQTLPTANLFDWLCPQGFCPGAGFDGIAEGIFMSSAAHAAKVIVDEKGTEAAAATSMGYATSAPPEPDLFLAADRPFLWAIVHADTGALLFVGRLVNPAA